MPSSEDPLLSNTVRMSYTSAIPPQSRGNGHFSTPENSLRGGHVSLEVPGKLKKLSSFKKTLGNMIVSIVGCGVLGLPYAFKRSGWAFSLAALAFMALVSFYGMLLLVKTRKLLESQHREQSLSDEGIGPPEGDKSSPSLPPIDESLPVSDSPALPPSTDSEVVPLITVGSPAILRAPQRAKDLPELEQVANGYFLKITSYGDLGNRVMGLLGQVLVDAMVCISQGGFCVAYLIFIGENISSLIAGGKVDKVPVIIAVASLQVLLSWVRSLSRLAHFSIFADVVNVCAFSVVIAYGIFNLDNFPSLKAFTGFENAPAALSVAVYSFEGVGNTLSLEGSMKEPLRFPSVLSVGVAIIASMYGSVGLMGYTAFADDTHQIVTLNLPKGLATTTVKLGLSLALCFTFPIMMYPVYEVYETRLCKQQFVRTHILPNTLLRRTMFRTLRALVICVVAYTAIGVPHFATFISLIGSSVCSLLGFVLPALFHLRVGSDSISMLERIVDYFLIVFGCAFGIWGTWDSVRQMLQLSHH